MPTREMLAALLLLTTVSGAAWGQCIDLYKTPAGSWGCGLPEPGGLYPYPVETENYGGTDGLTVWSLPTGANALPYAAKYVGVPFAPDGGGILIAPGVILMQAGWRLDTAVQWTARKAGIVSFSGFFEELQQMPIGTQLYIFYDQTDITGLCPAAWCRIAYIIALSGELGRSCQAATAGSLTMGSSLNPAMVSSVM